MLLRKTAATVDGASASTVSPLMRGACGISSPFIPLALSVAAPAMGSVRGSACYAGNSRNAVVVRSSYLGIASRQVATSVAPHGAFAPDEMPNAALMTHLRSRKQELLRLLRLAAGHGAAPLLRTEDVLRRHTEAIPTVTPAVGAPGRDMTKGAAEVATPSSVGLLSFDPPKPHSTTTASAAKQEWRRAVWHTLRWHCFFTDRSHHTRGEASQERPLSVVPFDWAATLARTSAMIPYEGWSEAELLACLEQQAPILQKYAPVWLPEYSGVDSFARWVHEYFSAVITVTRSAVTGEPLFHRTGCNSVSVTWQSPAALLMTGRIASPTSAMDSGVTASVQHALHTLGRGHQLPVWTDVANLTPLLPVRSGLTDGSPSRWKEAFAVSSELRNIFSIDGYVRVRAAQTPQSSLLVVDSTSLSPAELKELLKAEEGAFGVRAAVKLLLRRSMGLAERAAYAEACTAATGIATSVEHVVVEALLDPEHVLAALVGEYTSMLPADASTTAAAEECASPPSARVMVFCGAAARDRFAAVLKDVSAEANVVLLAGFPAPPRDGVERHATEA